MGGAPVAHEIIERYLTDALRPQLTDIGVPDRRIKNISASVSEQMMSCIGHWNDEPFRNTLLVIGDEEGEFYQPEATADIRNFVVVTLRNSMLESIHSDTYQPSGKGRRLTPEDIKAITSAAIEYFMKIDFQALAKQINLPKHDKYRTLSKEYPVTWAALTQIANTNTQVIRYNPIPVIAKPSLDKLERQHEKQGMCFEESRAQMMHIIADGYSLTIDYGLFHTLQNVLARKSPFLVDSFKGISRNIEKLLIIMEFVLGNDLPVITSNYLIANGYIECRLSPVKPGHDIEGMKSNWLNGEGLTENHKGWLGIAVEAYG